VHIHLYLHLQYGRFLLPQKSILYLLDLNTGTPDAQQWLSTLHVWYWQTWSSLDGFPTGLSILVKSEVILHLFVRYLSDCLRKGKGIYVWRFNGPIWLDSLVFLMSLMILFLSSCQSRCVCVCERESLMVEYWGLMIWS